MLTPFPFHCPLGNTTDTHTPAGLARFPPFSCLLSEAASQRMRPPGPATGGGPYHHHQPTAAGASSGPSRSPLSMLRLLDVALEIGRGLGFVRSTSFLEEVEGFVYRYASMGLAGLLKVC